MVWSSKNGNPAKGETGTSAPLVIKDKVLVGISGGEFGVQCHVTAYDLKIGKQVWRAYSVGPDDQLLIDPVKTTELGKPVGKDSKSQDLAGRSVEDWRRLYLGLMSYDPDLNLVYYGSGNPSTWNPSQRPGDNKWSMTIFARDADTGMTIRRVVLFYEREVVPWCGHYQKRLTLTKLLNAFSAASSVAPTRACSRPASSPTTKAAAVLVLR